MCCCGYRGSCLFSSFYCCRCGLFVRCAAVAAAQFDHAAAAAAALAIVDQASAAEMRFVCEGRLSASCVTYHTRHICFLRPMPSLRIFLLFARTQKKRLHNPGPASCSALATTNICHQAMLFTLLIRHVLPPVPLPFISPSPSPCKHQCVGHLEMLHLAQAHPFLPRPSPIPFPSSLFPRSRCDQPRGIPLLNQSASSAVPSPRPALRPSHSLHLSSPPSSL